MIVVISVFLDFSCRPFLTSILRSFCSYQRGRECHERYFAFLKIVYPPGFRVRTAMSVDQNIDAVKVHVINVKCFSSATDYGWITCGWWWYLRRNRKGSSIVHKLSLAWASFLGLRILVSAHFVYRAQRSLQRCTFPQHSKPDWSWVSAMCVLHIS